MLPAIAQPSVATANTASVPITTGRLPSASESAPCQSIISANASRYAESVCWMAIWETANSCRIAPNAGR